MPLHPLAFFVSILNARRLAAAALLLLAALPARAELGVDWTTPVQIPWRNSGQATQAFVYNNKMWVVASHKMWTSSDGISWSLASENPYGSSTVADLVVFKGKIWAVARSGKTAWSSTDGKTWNLATDSAPWEHVGENSTFVYNNKLWTIRFGTKYPIYSSDDGIHWTLISNALSPEWREQPALATFAGKIWLLGGEDHNDVWSTPDGKSWTQVTAHAPWRERQGLTAFVHEGKLWIAGGYEMEEFHYGWGDVRYKTYSRNDVWASPDGVQWTKVSDYAPTGIEIDDFSPLAVPMLSFAGKIWLFNDTACYSSLAPHLSAPSFVKDSQTTLTWSAVPWISGYTLQCDDEQNFATPLATTTFSSTTLKHIYNGLQDGKTVWFRVRGNRVGGLTSTWSNVTSCTRDAIRPEAWMTAYDHSPEWPLAATARLFLSAQDLGAKPTGVHQMRFSVNNRDWTAWQPFDTRASFWVGRTGTRRIFGQVSDRVGNVRDISTTVTCGLINALYVDDDNTSGPWSGTLERPYRKIQEAIDVSTSHGQTIIVAPGTYYERIDFKGKNIILRSSDPQSPAIVKTTVIDAQEKGPAVNFKGTEGNKCILAGFTITHGFAQSTWWIDPYFDYPELDDYIGGGIQGHGTHANLQYNRIIGNRADSSLVQSTDYTYYDCLYLGYGGGIAQCDGVIANNLIAFNRIGRDTQYSYYSKLGETREKHTTRSKSSMFPGIYTHTYDLGGSALFDCDGTIVNNTIWGNDALVSTSTLDQCNGLLRNNILWNPGMTELAHSAVPVRCCLPSAGQYPSFGNIPSNPRLADPAGGDFRLLPDSPCIDAGIVSSLAPFDIDGDRRGIDAATARRGDGSDFDIGADEFTPPNPPILLLKPHGGETFEAGGEFPIQFVMDPARAGTLAGFEVRNAAGVRIKGWRLSAEEALAGQIRHMPDDAGSGFRLRVFNNANTAVYTESPPFTIRKRNAVAPKGWAAYR